MKTVSAMLRTAAVAASVLGAMAQAAGNEDAAPVTPAAPDPATAPLLVTGSSTVVPYALVAASLPGQPGGDADPLSVFVEATGTAAGLATLCRPGDVAVAGASRAVTTTELAACQRLGVDTIIEVELGLGAIVMVQSAITPAMPLTPADIFTAVAETIPVGAACTPSPNRRRRWSEVRADLPDRPIVFYGPPVTSGTRDIFAKKALAVGARTLPCLAELERDDPEAFEAALAIRNDGVWVDGGESDGAAAYALTRLPDAIGILGRVHALAQDNLTVLPFAGVHPTAETIADGRYALSLPLFAYATAGAVTKDARVKPLIAALSSTAATGPGGTLAQMGLTPNTSGTIAKLISTEDGSETVIVLGN